MTSFTTSDLQHKGLLDEIRIYNRALSAFGTAEFGGALPLGVNMQYELITAKSVDPANIEGCSAWADTPFEGKAALMAAGMLV